MKTLAIIMGVLLAIFFILSFWFFWMVSTRDVPSIPNYEIKRTESVLPEIDFPDVPLCEHCKG
jgi:uncharacterized protein (DUF58 family)